MSVIRTADENPAQEAEIAYRIPGAGGFKRKTFKDEATAQKWIDKLLEKEGNDVEVRWKSAAYAVRRAMLRGVVARFMRATSGIELDRSRRSKINSDLIHAGLDGNGRFRNMSVALSRIDDKLSSAGVQFDEVITAGDVSAPEGRISINLAAKGDNPFNPVPIRNTSLAVHWTALPVGYEVVAYLG